MPPELQDLENAANQILEGGAQETVNQEDEQGDAAQQTVIPSGETEDTEGDAQTKEQEGLKAALVAEQKKRQELNDALALERARNQMYQQQMLQAQQPQQPQRDPNELLTLGEVQQREAMLLQQLQLQNLRTQYSDIDDVVGINSGNMGYQPSDEVKKVIQSNPQLANITQFIAAGNPQAISIAYNLAKQQKELDMLKEQQRSIREQRNMMEAQNKTDVMSPAAAGGAGGVNIEQQVPTDTDSAEFAQFIADIKAGKYDTT